MKRCSRLVVMCKSKQHIQPKWLYIFLKWKLTNVGKDLEKLEHLHATGGNIKWHSCCGTVWKFLKKFNRITNDAAIPLLDIYIKKKKKKAEI